MDIQTFVDESKRAQAQKECGRLMAGKYARDMLENTLFFAKPERALAAFFRRYRFIRWIFLAVAVAALFIVLFSYEKPNAVFWVYLFVFLSYAFLFAFYGTLMRDKYENFQLKGRQLRLVRFMAGHTAKKVFRRLEKHPLPFTANYGLEGSIIRCRRTDVGGNTKQAWQICLKNPDRWVYLQGADCCLIAGKSRIAGLKLLVFTDGANRNALLAHWQALGIKEWGGAA